MIGVKFCFDLYGVKFYFDLFFLLGKLGSEG